MSSSTNCPLCHPQPKAKRFGLGIQPCLDSRFRGNDGRGAGMTHPLVIPNRKPLVILNRKQSASDWGSSPIWIPVFTGMTREGCGNDTFFVILNQLPPLSSSTESKALRIGDPEITDWIPVVTGMTHPCHPQPKAKRFGLGIQRLQTGFPLSRE